MLTKTLAALALVALTTGTAAKADQFAKSLGVEPGVYTTAELIQLRDARERNEQSRETFIMRGGSTGNTSIETKMKAFSASTIHFGPEAVALRNFRNSAENVHPVSESTIAFAQAHLADVADEND